MGTASNYCKLAGGKEKMRRTKKIIAGVLLGVMTLSLSACGNSTPTTEEGAASKTAKETEVAKETQAAGTEEKETVTGELTPVTIGIDTEQLAFVQVVAQEKGFFEENGLDAELTGYAAGIETINAVVLGEVQIGAAYDYAACTRLAEKTNLRLAASYVVNADDALWFETTVEGATSAADLKGKKIGLLQGTLQEYLWAKELESGGLTADDVEISYLGSNAEVYTAYATGQVDAVQGSNTFLEQIEAVEGRTVLNTTGDLGATAQGYIMADATFLEEQPEVMEGYYVSLQQGLDYIEANREEAAQICADYMTLQKEDVLKAFDAYHYDIRFLQEDYDHLQDIADWCYENNVTDEIQVKDYMNISAISNLYPDKVTYQEQ